MLDALVGTISFLSVLTAQQLEALQLCLNPSTCSVMLMGSARVQEPTLFLIANDAKPNEWGNSPSYGIFHGNTAPQLLPDNHPLVR